MRCEKIQELLPAFQDGELTRERAQEVASHLEGCLPCQKEAELWASSWKTLNTIETLVPSPDFQARFWAKAHQEELKPAGWKSFGWKPSGWRNGFEWAHFKPAAWSLVGMAALWFIGVMGGLVLFKKQSENASATIIHPLTILISPTPQNSIEQIFLEGSETKETNS